MPCALSLEVTSPYHVTHPSIDATLCAYIRGENGKFSRRNSGCLVSWVPEKRLFPDKGIYQLYQEKGVIIREPDITMTQNPSSPPCCATEVPTIIDGSVLKRVAMEENERLVMMR